MSYEGENSQSFSYQKNNRSNFWTRIVKRPTYEVVGKLERYDLRDLLPGRAALTPGTEHYNAYYRQHPELEERDNKLRVFSSPEDRRRQKEALFSQEPLALALSNIGRLAEHLNNATKIPPVSKVKVKLTPKQASHNIKGVARYLGADLIGIAKINPAWVYSHWGRDERDGFRWGDPIEVPYNYAISIAVAQNFDMLLAGRGISLAPCIETNEFAFNRGAVIGIRLAAYIRALGYPAECSIPGGKVQDIPIAIDAGLGELGRNGLLITKEFGPALRLNTIITDLPLEVDEPVDIGMQDFCSKCMKCADNCSSGAVSQRGQEIVRGVKIWPVDNELCYKLRVSHGGEPVCFTCMSTCPWTKPHNLIHRAAAELASRSSLARTALIWLDDFLYGIKPRAHPFPDWLDFDKEKQNLKSRIITFLHKI